MNGSTVAVYVHSVAEAQFVVAQGSASVPEPVPCTVAAAPRAAAARARIIFAGVIVLT